MAPTGTGHGGRAVLNRLHHHSVFQCLLANHFQLHDGIVRRIIVLKCTIVLLTTACLYLPYSGATTFMVMRSITMLEDV